MASPPTAAEAFRLLVRNRMLVPTASLVPVNEAASAIEEWLGRNPDGTLMVVRDQRGMCIRIDGLRYPLPDMRGNLPVIVKEGCIYDRNDPDHPFWVR